MKATDIDRGMATSDISASLSSEAVRDLLSRIADGDQVAFKQFFDAYNNRFYRAVLKMTSSAVASEEIVQEVFMQLWHKKESLVQIENPDSYLFTTVYRRVYRYYQNEIRLSKLYKEIADPSSESENTTEQMVLASESDRLILEAIERLPSKQKQVFIMTKRQGLSRDEVAKALQLSPNTVRNHLHQAIKFIKAQLEGSHAAFFLFYLLLKNNF